MLKRYVVLIGFFIAPLLILTAPFEDDEYNLPRSPESGIPLQILYGKRVQAIFGDLGYRESLKRAAPIWSTAFRLLERDSSITYQYLTGESIRMAELLSQASGCPSQPDFLHTFLGDRSKGAVWHHAKKRYNSCSEKLFKKHERSPEIMAAIERNLAELRAIDCHKWTGVHLELAADYHFATGQGEKGYAYLTDALAERIASRDYAEASHVAGRIGAYNARKGNFEKAEESYRSSLSFAQRIDDPYYISRTLSFLSLLKATQGYFIEAESLQVRALEYCERVRDPSCEIAKLLALARMFNSFGEIERAEYLAEKTILIAEDHLSAEGRKKPGMRLQLALQQYLASALALKSKIQLSREEAEAAIRTMNRAVAIGKDSVDRQFAAELQKRLGDAYRAAGKGTPARKWYRKAIRGAQRLKNTRREAEYLTALAIQHLADEQIDEAERLLRESLRIARGERYWMQLIESKHLLGRAKAARGDHSGAKGHYRDAIAAFERESWGRYGPRKHAMIRRVHKIYADLILLESEHDKNSDSLLYWAEKERRVEAAVDAIPEERFSNLMEECIGGDDWIPQGAAVVQHLVTPERMIILVSGRSETHQITIDTTPDELEHEIRSFIHECSESILPESGDRGADHSGGPKTHSHTLFDLLIEPIVPLITGKDLLCFIEEGILGYLPFGALIRREGDQKYLYEEYTIITAPSLLYLYRNRTERDPGTVAAAADPFEKPLLIGEPIVAKWITRLYPHAAPLPRSGSEIEKIAVFLPGCLLFRGRRATEEAFIREAEDADLIHIATHTVHYPVYEGSSALVFSPPDGESPDAGSARILLTTEEISGLDLSGVKLVILSSCESLSGRPSGKRGFRGIAAAFLEAGARAVIASSWPLEDRAAEEVATILYENLCDGPRNPVSALHHTLRRLIEEDRSVGNPGARIGMWAPYQITCPFSLAMD
ncbi:MAG: CHAT domain-containing protein [bacterium]|nr:MAG: CHAT domain-containing protein [bacterium]